MITWSDLFRSTIQYIKCQISQKLEHRQGDAKKLGLEPQVSWRRFRIAEVSCQVVRTPPNGFEIRHSRHSTQIQQMADEIQQYLEEQ